MEYVLGPKRTAVFGDVSLRINADLRKGVAFVGYLATDLADESRFVPGGTGFFIRYGGVCYFVTARHVAEALEPPFTLRATSESGKPVTLDITGASWFFHPDDSVDLAMVLGIPETVPAINSSALLTPEIAAKRQIGVGDEAYIIGLYRLLHGKNKNQPVVHCGSLAMLPEDERIPQRNRTTGEVQYVEGYLVEAQTLEGLSGSPVFVRHVWHWNAGGQYAMLLGDAYLLGVWSGAWDAPPGEVLSQEYPGAKRVPVGMGLAVPTYKLLELLEMPNVVEHRKRRLAEEGAVNEDSAVSGARDDSTS